MLRNHHFSSHLPLRIFLFTSSSSHLPLHIFLFTSSSSHPPLHIFLFTSSSSRSVQHITAGARNLIEQYQTAALDKCEQQRTPSGTMALFSYHLLIPTPLNPAAPQ
jgi:hypothetical protein